MKVRRYAIAIVLAIAIGAPILEMFDQWDPTIQDGGGDTETNAVLVVLCVGFAFVTTNIMFRRVPALQSSVVSNALAVPDTSPLQHVPLRSSTPTGRAPTPLRV